ncbi:hypothetical protein F5Y10DRAFT_290382 [Nemania abortiva]|nr:hypothetical protein F5Y10DRAFT_290382 [Nemania abortiva]
MAANPKTPAREAWTADGSDLKSNPEFDRVFERFYSLDERRRVTREDYKSYVRDSWRQLYEACRALHIPGTDLPSEQLFNNDTLPTYVDHSCGSKEFLYGKGSRPGILSLKSRLGAPLLVEEEKGIRDASKKRVAGQSSKGAKRARTSGGYSLTIVNATADIEDVLRDSHFLSVRDPEVPRPDAERLVTPTVGNRKQILAAYRGELRSIADAIYNRKFKKPLNKANLPSTSKERKAWLQLADSEIKTARASVHFHLGDAGSPAKAKQLRLAAYRLKLSRALYMVGLLSGEPAASATEVQDALRERLEDWILHEQAWNAGDRHLQMRAGLTQDTFDQLQYNIAERDANISKWRDLQNELGGTAPTGTDTDSASPSTDTPILTEEQIKNGKAILNDIMFPTIRYRSTYREHQKIARERLTGQPIPEWTYKPVVNPFLAGGPPGWETLPTGTCWERLQLMWVMTSWRVYQLRELEP